jgi:hypothetical protein
MNYDELKNKYKKVPDELKKLKRWVCFKVENKDGENKKMPIKFDIKRFMVYSFQYIDRNYLFDYQV